MIAIAPLLRGAHAAPWTRRFLATAYASISPGFTIVMPSQDGAENATGFAIGAAAGVSYDVSPAMFVSGEVGYQRAFTSVEDSALGQTIEMDVDLSYLHVGLGAGARF